MRCIGFEVCSTPAEMCSMLRRRSQAVFDATGNDHARPSTTDVIVAAFGDGDLGGRTPLRRNDEGHFMPNKKGSQGLHPLYVYPLYVYSVRYAASMACLNSSGLCVPITTVRLFNLTNNPCSPCILYAVSPLRFCRDPPIRRIVGQNCSG